LRHFSFGGYGLALPALALVLFGAYDSSAKKVQNLGGKFKKPYIVKFFIGQPLT